MGGGNDSDEQFLLDVVRRLPVLVELREGPRTSRELSERIETSKATIHRATTALTEHGLVARHDGEYALTNVGRTVAEAATGFREHVLLARRLAPLLETVADTPVNLDPELLADATVTTATPADPYAPVRRFTSLVRETDRIRAFDTTTIEPVNFGELVDRTRDGMRTEVVYEPSVVERLIANHPEQFVTGLDQGELDVWVHDDVPFGLTLFDDRVGIGGYDDETGMLRTYADTDDADAVAWGEELFERYVEQAELLEATDTGLRVGSSLLEEVTREEREHTHLDPPSTVASRSNPP